MNRVEVIEGVSIVICCYNSASRLPQTLTHIAHQKVSPSIPWEVIVINNASKDNTTEVAQQVWAGTGCNIPFQVVNEPTPGLSHAREKGFGTAKYEFVLFCDDDNWLNDDYVQVGYTILQANQEIGALGGHGEAVCEVTPPSWFNSIGLMVFAMAPQASTSGEVPKFRNMVYGAGSFIRRSAYLHLKSYGFKSRLTDRKGKEMSSGGDDELCYALRLLGYKIWYDERLYFKHFIPKDRLTWDYVKRFFQGSAKANIVLGPFNDILKTKHNSQAKIKPYTSIKKSLSFFKREGIPFFIHKLTKGKSKVSESSLPERMNFYLRLLIAKHLLIRYKEYDKNLFIYNDLKNKIDKTDSLTNIRINRPVAVFESIYEQNLWGDPESKSGTGSNLVQTAIIRKEIPNIVKQFGIKSMLDAPCGDYYWMKEIKEQLIKYGVKYTGADIVPAIVKDNNARYSNALTIFIQLDIINNVPPKVDLIFSRDCLVHLSYQDIYDALRQFKKSGSVYLLTTTFTGNRLNKNIHTGDWRPLNLLAPPFSFPKSLLVINENCTEDNGIYADKSIGLWKLKTISLWPLKYYLLKARLHSVWKKINKGFK